MRVDCAVQASELTIDPSFRVLIYSIEQHNVTMCCYLLMCEMTTNDCEVTLQTAIERRWEWVAIIAEERVTQKQRTLLRGHASRIFEYRKGDNVCLIKGWWMTSERQSNHRATSRYGTPQQGIGNCYTCRRAMKIFAGGQLDFINPEICSAT